MSASLFYFDNEGSISALREAPFVSDAELQTLIAEHPSLLGGDPETDTGRFVLERVGQTPFAAARTPRWSADHLFLGPDAVPTIVETRWSGSAAQETDLFGRSLYYAANAGAWWPDAELRSSFSALYAGPDREPDVALRRFIGRGRSAEAYWAEVGANLAAGRLRMVLVVEEIPDELARMVRFLGGQLRDAEVWLLEVRQQIARAGRIMSLRLIGRRDQDETVAEAAIPQAAPVVVAALPPPPSRETWIRTARAQCDPSEVEALDHLLSWMGEQYGAIFVTGPPEPALRLAVKEAGKDRFPFGLTDARTASVHLGSLSASRAFESPEARQSVVDELIATGLKMEVADLKSDVRIALKDLTDREQRTKLLRVLDGAIESLRLKEAPSAFHM